MDPRCCQNDLLRAIANRDGWQEKLKGICTVGNPDDDNRMYIIIALVGWLEFMASQTFVDYLMPNPFLC